MKVSNTIKKVVVLSVFCAQMLTLLPMQEIQPRPTRGISAMSMTSELTFPGSVNLDESLPRDPESERKARQTRLDTLFRDEGDTIINIPKLFQDEKNPANLDEAIKAVISQDEDKDPKALAEQQERKATLAARLSLSEVNPEIEIKLQADQPAPTQANLDSKIKEGKQLTEKIKGYLQQFKEKGNEVGSYVIVALNAATIVWSSIDTANHAETLPYAIYIADATLVMLTFVAQSLHALHNKLKKEVDEAFIPEDQPEGNPQPALSFTQRCKNTFSNSWSSISNYCPRISTCFSKIKAIHLITGAAVTSAFVTFVAAKWPAAISPIAAEWVNNGETIIDGIVIGWLVFSKAAINKLNKILAQKQIERRKSADGILHRDVELPTLPDRRPSLNPEIGIQIKPTHTTKGSIEMVASLPDESPIAMVINPLAEVTDSGTPTPTKNTPEKRDSSDRDSGNPTPTTLPRRAVEAAPAELPV